jgi:hypothetical protein
MKNAQTAIVRSSSKLILVLGMPNYLSSLPSFPLRNHLPLSERQRFQVLPIHVDLAPFVS